MKTQTAEDFLGKLKVTTQKAQTQTEFFYEIPTLKETPAKRKAQATENSRKRTVDLFQEGGKKKPVPIHDVGVQVIYQC